MNFSDLLNPGGSGGDQPTEPSSSSRMRFDYLTSEHNMTPLAGSPAFYSTPSEFVGDSDGEGVTGLQSSVNFEDQSLLAALSDSTTLLKRSRDDYDAEHNLPSSAPSSRFESEQPLQKPIPSTNEPSPEPSKPLKPLTTTHLRASIDPESARNLSAPFQAYVPPRVGPGGAVISDSEEEDEDVVRKRTQARRAATLAAKGKSRARIEEEEREEADDRLYCVCRELYDPERMMIACDRCEEWYHVDCVGIPDDSVELVDSFFCPPCQTKYSKTTTWHTCCARPTCRKPSIALSKYCSDYCGISVVSARLELLKLSNGTNPSTFWGRVEGARRREAKVIDHGSRPSRPSNLDNHDNDDDEERLAIEDARTLSRLQTKLEETNLRRTGLTEAVARVEKRLVYLKIAIKRWGALCQATADGLASAGLGGGGAAANGGVETDTTKTSAGGRKGAKKKGGRGKKKGPVAATSLPEAQCGFDVRLVYDDQAWREWVESEATGQDPGEEAGGKVILDAKEREEDEVALQMALEMLEGVCLETRKKCERHTGWQKLREADFQVEKAVLLRRLDRLTSLSQSLESQISLHQQATAFRQLNRNRSVSPTRLISVDTFMEDLQARQPRKVKLKSKGMNGDGQRRSGSPVVNRNGASRGGPPSFRRSDYVAGGAGDDSDGGGGGGEQVDVPAELLPFLSRAELARLKSQRR